MLIRSAAIMDENFQLRHADILVKDGKIEAIGENLPVDGEVVEYKDCTVVPGFVDVHIHGCMGADASDGKTESVEKMAEFLVGKGVTSFCPTTMTMYKKDIEVCLKCIKECMDKPHKGARVLGAHMEGPYIAMSKKGAQKGECVRCPDWNEFKELYDNCGGIVKIVVVAPETEGADEFIKHAKELCTVSIAHTDANYEEAKHGFDMGITHATHLYNAMNGLKHREPGVVGAVMDDDRVMAEIICDGFHIEPAVLRITFRILKDRIMVISDSMSATGMCDGQYELGGQAVFVKDGKARLKDGTIAGSTTFLHQELKNLVRFGIPFEQAVKSMTLIPALSIGEEKRIGSIQKGKLADLVVLDSDLNIKDVFVEGKRQ